MFAISLQRCSTRDLFSPYSLYSRLSTTKTSSTYRDCLLALYGPLIFGSVDLLCWNKILYKTQNLLRKLLKTQADFIHLNRTRKTRNEISNSPVLITNYHCQHSVDEHLYFTINESVFRICTSTTIVASYRARTIQHLTGYVYARLEKYMYSC